MKVIKNIGSFIFNIIKITFNGFIAICYMTSYGFYYYFVILFKFISKLFKNKNMFLNKIVKHFEKRQFQPQFLVLSVIYIVCICLAVNIFWPTNSKTVSTDKYIYSGDDNKTHKDDGSKDVSSSSNSNEGNSTSSNVSTDSNLYKRYGSISLDNVNLKELKKFNSDTVAWLCVDGTSINYPIVKRDNNDYYLKHSFDGSKKISGWTFMDYRNSVDTLSNNTVIYGHNLLNKTAFGSISNIFTSEWLKSSNRSIVLLTETKKYVFKIFSAYTTSNEVYYLQTKFKDNEVYQNFLYTIRARSTVNLNESVTFENKILTLSTCTENNKGRKVVHAKLVGIKNN